MGRAGPGPRAVISLCVIVVNWNGGGYLLRCLQSVQQQSLRASRVIVYDNASSDGSLEQARARFPEFEFLASGENLGFARANNLCVQRCADCAWVFLLNPDAVLLPDCVENLAQATQHFPDVDCFAPLIVQDACPALVDSAGIRYPLSGVALQRLRGRPTSGVRECRAVFAPSAAAGMYRRQAFLNCGGFDESFFAYYEDVDLGFRLCLDGARSMLVPAAAARHVGGGTTGGPGNAYSSYYGQRNFILTYFKNMPWPLFWAGLPLHLVAVARGIAAGVIRGHGSAVLTATKQALAALPAAWMQRRRIQRTRKVSLRLLVKAMELRAAPPDVGGDPGAGSLYS